MSTAEHNHETRPDVQAIREWLEPLIRVHVWFRQEHGQWYCLAEEFDITGMGSTHDACYEDMIGLLGAYLDSHYKAGTPFVATLRPIPAKLKLQIRIQAALAGVAARIAQRRNGAAEPKSEELAAFIPADSLVHSYC